MRYFSLFSLFYHEKKKIRGKRVGITNAPKIVFSFRKMSFTKVKGVFSKKLKYFPVNNIGEIGRSGSYLQNTLLILRLINIQHINIYFNIIILIMNFIWFKLLNKSTSNLDSK